jgi:hypothetical protein
MITIVPYQPTWPAEFAEIASTLRAALGDLALRIDHIGSTSVPGLDCQGHYRYPAHCNLISMTSDPSNPPCSRSVTPLTHTTSLIIARLAPLARTLTGRNVTSAPLPTSAAPTCTCASLDVPTSFTPSSFGTSCAPTRHCLRLRCLEAYFGKIPRKQRRPSPLCRNQRPGLRRDYGGCVRVGG